MMTYFSTRVSNYVILNFLTLGFFAVSISSCDHKSRIAERNALDVPDGMSIQHDASHETGGRIENEESTSSAAAFHRVVILERLPTSKYLYLRVAENEQEYWIATKKMKVEVGARYFYGKRLLKTNFESKEHKRTFDRLYLVSTLVSENHGNEMEPMDGHAASLTSSDPARLEAEAGMSDEMDGNIKNIRDLLSRKDALSGKQVVVKGRCIKVNSNIMGRNWVHLQDGSYDEYDLVVTTNSTMTVGDEVKVEATVALKKDYGSGYYYDLILEDGRVVEIF
jgi:hypothetical protein